MLPPIQPPILCAAASNRPDAPKGPLGERRKLVRDLEHRIFNSPDAIELRQRLEKVADTSSPYRAYMLPYHILLTNDRFNLGVPEASGSYSFYRPLTAHHLRDIKTAKEAEEKIAARLHEYAKDPDLAWEYTGSGYGAFAWDCLRSDLRSLARLLTAPLRAIGSLFT